MPPQTTFVAGCESTTPPPVRGSGPRQAFDGEPDHRVCFGFC